MTYGNNYSPVGNQLLAELQNARGPIAAIMQNNREISALESAAAAKARNLMLPVKGSFRYTVFVGGFGCTLAYLIAYIIEAIAGDPEGLLTQIALTVLFPVLFILASRCGNRAKGFFLGATVVYALGFMVSRAIHMARMASWGAMFFAGNSMVTLGALVIALLVSQWYNVCVFRWDSKILNYINSIETRIRQLRADNNRIYSTISWYPQDYIDPDCLDRFINIVRNHRAHTVPEMMNVFLNDERNKAIARAVAEMQRKVETAQAVAAEASYQAQKAKEDARTANIRADQAEYKANEVKRKTERGW